MTDFDGRKGLFAGREINLDVYDSAVDAKNYIFGSFRKALAFEYEFPLSSHCNLNCQMCTVFSPIAETSFLSMESFYSDLSRMGSLFGSRNVWFRMVGGEPLLHPQITEMMLLARKILPNALISITTNGLLARKMGDAFYAAARNRNIVILNSPYPPVDADGVVMFMKNLGINAFKTVQKFTSRKLSLDVSGRQDAKGNFDRCGYRCNFILNGKLSRCFYPMVINHFNKKFGQELKTTENDFIDIHKHDEKEIRAFLQSPIDFCRYCKNDKIEYFGWKQSTKEISEWI